MAAIIYKPPHETQRLWKRQEKFKASWKPLVTSQGEALGTRGYKCFYYLSLGAGYRVTIDLWRFTDSCILLDAYYFTETECLTSSRYFLTWNISVCMRGRRRTGGREMKGGRENGRRRRKKMARTMRMTRTRFKRKLTALAFKYNYQVPRPSCKNDA